MKRKVECANGRFVERFWDRSTRSSVTIVVDKEGNQIGDADYSGNQVTANHMRDHMIAENGGEVIKKKKTKQSTDVVEVALCEVSRIFLRPDQLYKFVVMDNCSECATLAAISTGAIIWSVRVEDEAGDMLTYLRNPENGTFEFTSKSAAEEVMTQFNKKPELDPMISCKKPVAMLHRCR